MKHLNNSSKPQIGPPLLLENRASKAKFQNRFKFLQKHPFKMPLENRKGLSLFFLPPSLSGPEAKGSPAHSLSPSALPSPLLWAKTQLRSPSRGPAAAPHVRATALAAPACQRQLLLIDPRPYATDPWAPRVSGRGSSSHRSPRDERLLTPMGASRKIRKRTNIDRLEFFFVTNCPWPYNCSGVWFYVVVPLK